MKVLLKIYIIILCIGLLGACNNDFDELNDTNQRHILFTFNTDSLFSNLLSTNGETYYISEVNALPSGYHIRITAYCYTEDGLLFQTKKIITPLHSYSPIKFRHLLLDQKYRFVFLADVVKYDSQNDYYETWYQLGTDDWKTLYLYADERNEDAIYNVVGLSTCVLSASNQEEVVNIRPITYNGFCKFTQLSSVDHLSGYIKPCISFSVKTLRWTRIASAPYEFDYRNPNKDITKPVSLSYADSIITVQLITNTLAGKDTSLITIPNPKRRSFVATFDCLNHALEDCTFY